MRGEGFSCVSLNPSWKKSVIGMARDGFTGGDFEEGEISRDGRWMKDSKAERYKGSKDSGGSGGFWSEKFERSQWQTDFSGYQTAASKNYSTGLYNFAWAQAVQKKKKPTEGIGLQDIRSDYEKWLSTFVIGHKEEEKTDSHEGGKKEGEKEQESKDLVNPVDEKEDGELEEGEIGMEESGSRENEEEMEVENCGTVQTEAASTKEKELEDDMNSLGNSLKDLPAMPFSGGRSLLKEPLDRVNTSNSTASHSTNLKLYDSDKEDQSRLPCRTLNLFSEEQVQEQDGMILSQVKLERNEVADSRISLSSSSFLGSKGSSSSSEKQGYPMLQKQEITNSGNTEGIFSSPPSQFHRKTSVNEGSMTKKLKSENDDNYVYSSVNDALKAVSSYQQKFGRTSFLSSNRLPSPTPSEEAEVGGTDTNEEVSSAGQATGVPSSKLDTSNYFASSRNAGSFTQKELPGFVSTQPASFVNSIIKPQLKSRDPRLKFAASNFGTNDLNKGLQQVNQAVNTTNVLETVDRKQKASQQAELDGPSAKRLRNGEICDAKGLFEVAAGGGWLQKNSTAIGVGDRIQSSMEFQTNSAMIGQENRVLAGFNAVLSSNGSFNSASSGVRVSTPDTVMASAVSSQASGMATSASLPALWRTIDPQVLMHAIKTEQHRLAAGVVQNVDYQSQTLGRHPSIPVQISTPAPVVSAGITGTSSSLILPEANVKVGQSQLPNQTVSLAPQKEDLGKSRIKARDPRRRFLQDDGQLKIDSLPSKQVEPKVIAFQSVLGKANAPAVVPLPLSNAPPLAPLPLHSAPPLAAFPDISNLLTGNFKPTPDIINGSNLNKTVPAIPLSNMQMNPINVQGSVSILSNQAINSSPIDANPSDSSESQDPWGDVEHLLEGMDEQQKAAIQKERARRIEEQNRMFAARKLCLVLDLDHTLLNSAKFIEVDKVHEDILKKKEEVDKEKPQRHLFRFPHMGMWTKLRPGVWTFLERASKLYELHLYTMGNKIYATEMAKVLDPTGELFNGRVISKGDDGDIFDGDDKLPKSKDLDGVLGMESAVLIIDDSIKVWPHHRHNLIVVERYTYFPCSRKQFGLFGPSLLEVDRDERQEDGTLASSLAVIERIHKRFFANEALSKVDIRDILLSEQRRILFGCTILFSRVIPIGEVNPHLHPLWKLAEQFGAACTNQISDQVTHVVASSLGTDKVNWAAATGRFVVNPGWLEASTVLYRRANEYDFPVKP